MTRFFQKFSLPLLGKELIEQAARKRTYGVRVLYASLLFLSAYLLFYETLRVATASPLAVLGRGRHMFSTLVGLQFAGIYFFMPAMTCGVLTQEKERASLQLLFLTRLGPWAILFEKLMSRLIPMLGFLLLSLPLLGFAYTLGGISLDSLCEGMWMLVVATIQMGTLALACSAFFRTTVGAFIWSYLFTLIMFFGPALGWLLLYSITGLSSNRVCESLGIDQYPWNEILVLPFFGPATFGGSVISGRPTAWPLVIHSVFALGASVTFMVIARVCIVRRAFLTPRNVVLNVFKILDGIFLRLNNNPLTRGFVFIGDTATLPTDEPVAWRETAKRSLGKAQYLLRVFIAIEIPVAVLCLVIAFAAESGEPLAALLVPVWIVAGLMVSAQAASLIAGERSHQTLDVLCATPMTGREIVRQKYRSVRRLILVLWIPLFTVAFFECAMRWKMPGNYTAGPLQRGFNLPLFVVCSALSAGIYLPLFAWLSLLIGLKVRTQGRAIMGSMAAIVGWCVGPMIFIVLPLDILFRGTGSDTPLVVQLAMLLSPATIVISNEQMFRHEYSWAPWVAVILNFTGYGAALCIIRNLCLRHVDRLLGRLESKWPDLNLEFLPRFLPSLETVDE